jgi:hypothetical protein
VTGVEVLIAALVAGAGSGVSEVTKSALSDAYGAFVSLLRRGWRGKAYENRAVELLEGGEYNALVPFLTDAGLDGAPEVVNAAGAVLAVHDPSGVAAGKYRVSVGQAANVSIGDTNIDAPHNQGAVGTFNAPVTFGAVASNPREPGGR